jgi:hypothetical protein
MQKLVTVALSDNPPRHGAVEEHLQGFLRDGWEIQSVSSVGGGVGHSYADSGSNMQGFVAGWIVVLLEKSHG